MNIKPHTFQTFVTTPSNRQARIAAEKVCRFPGGVSQNPLVLYGKHGTGKTHLLHAMAASFLENDIPNICVPAHQMAREMIESIQNRDIGVFEELYQQADVLLIDDIDDLVRKEETQKSVLHLVEDLLKQGKQVVITGNELLFENSMLLSSLRELLSRGLSVQLDTPDLEAKTAFVEETLSNHGIHWPKAACMYVAAKANDSINQLEGELNKVEFLCSCNR